MGNSFGSFLKLKRQEKKLTQKELAKLLIVSESAVSKWEKDVAHPDITLLPKLAEILGVTEHEIITASIDKKTREEKVQAKKWRAFALSWSLFFYISYAVAIIPCFICNLAIDKTLSWFWIVVAALLVAFTFTNLPKLITKNKLLILPLSMYGALFILLGVCAIYTKGNWFWISIVSVLLCLIIIFMPIYISKYKIFAKVRNYTDFIAIGIDFVFLNILLIIIDFYTINNNFISVHWYFNIALPIVVTVYLILNILLCVKFIKVNKLLKTSIILYLINLFMYIPPIFINVKNENVQKELYDINIFKADFSRWNSNFTIENNIHCMIFLIISVVASIFLMSGLIKHFKRK